MPPAAQATMFSEGDVAVLRSTAFCIVRGYGTVHHPVRINAQPRPDTTWWCTFCGLDNLPAPVGKRPWE